MYIAIWSCLKKWGAGEEMGGGACFLSSEMGRTHCEGQAEATQGFQWMNHNCPEQFLVFVWCPIQHMLRISAECKLKHPGRMFRMFVDPESKTYPNISKHIQTYPNISTHIHTYPHISTHIQAMQNYGGWGDDHEVLSGYLALLQPRCHLREGLGPRRQVKLQITVSYSQNSDFTQRMIIW